jgi:tetratricopeptide (TPR) repeat protein
VRLFAEIGDAKAEALALKNLGGNLMNMARMDEAWKRLTEAYEKLEALGHRQGCSGTLSSMSVIEVHRNHHEKARELQLEALRTAQEIGWMRSVGTCQHNLGWAAIEQLRVAEGLHWYEAALSTWLQIGDADGEMNTRSALRGVYVILLGDWERAEEQLEAVENHAQHKANPRNRWFGLDTRQLIAEQQGGPEAALEFAQQKQQIAAAHNDTPMELLARWAMARLRCTLNEPQALELLANLEPEVNAFGMQGLEAEFHGQLGEALLRAGQPEEALQHLEQCLTKYGVDPQAERERSDSEFVQPCPAVHHLRALALRELERFDEALRALQRAHRELIAAFEGVGEEVRQLAFERVPDWRALLQSWEQYSLRRVTTQLPSSIPNAPAVTVHLTLEAPEDFATHDKVERRRAQLRRVLHEAAQQGAMMPRVADLAALFGCGSATVKRDLAALRALTQPVEATSQIVPQREAVTLTR